MELQRHKPLTPRKSQPLSSLDNHLAVQGHRGGLSHPNVYQDENGLSFKAHQPNKPGNIPSLTYLDDDDRIQKENRPPVLQRIQTPPTSIHHHPGYSSTGATNNNTQIRQSAPPRRIEQTRYRPTAGGKTVSLSLMNKVNQSYHGNVINENTSEDSNDNNTDDKNNSNNDNIHFYRQRTKQRHLIEQRMSPEQLKLLSRRIDPSLPVSPHGSPSKPALPSIFMNGRIKSKSSSSSSSSQSSQSPPTSSPCRLSSLSSSLYQTCIDLWPSEPTLGDFASENIKNLTDLLKVRLSQAKYRILAQLEVEEQQESEGKDCDKMYPTISSAANVLRDDEIDYSTWPTFQKHMVELSTKRTQSGLCVSGNGQRLFRHRDTYIKRHRIKQQQQQQLLIQKQQQQQQSLKYSLDLGVCSPSLMIDNRTNEKHSTVFPPPASIVKTEAKRKRRARPKTADGDSPRDEGRIQASLVSPVVLENGSQVYVCTPCEKKYKTRNGLAYHFNRCPAMPNVVPATSTSSQPMETTQSQEQPFIEQQLQLASPSLSSGSKSSGVNCVCDHPTDDEKMMVQCDECQQWLHLDCVGTNETVLDDIYNCPRCTDRLTKRRRLESMTTPQRQDMTSLVFHQLNNNNSGTNAAPATSDSFAYPPLTTTTTTAATATATTMNNNVARIAPDINPSTSSTQSSQPVWDDFDLLDRSSSGQAIVASSVTVSNTTTPANNNNNNNNNNNKTKAKANNSTSNDVNMWGLSTADIPSLLYSDATAMTSTLDDDLPYLMDLPSSELSPHDLPPTDWFQFANFDDDFHCDDSQTTQ